jgi:hypothetical protein
MTTNLYPRDYLLLQNVVERQEELNAALSGKIVIMASGIYAGRRGRVDSVQMHSGYNPGWLFYIRLSEPGWDDYFYNLIVARHNEFQFEDAQTPGEPDHGPTQA